MNSYPIKAFLLFVLFSNLAFSQQTKKVLFIGNSYTDFNDLPSMIASMANNTGDQLIHDKNTPGGYRFLNHANNATTLAKIQSNTWDYVVLQAQSQEAAFSQSQMQSQLFPYATTLSNLIRQNNPCSQPIFYMTWGRQNGDSSNCPYLPWVCNYESMDNVIRSSYEYMADQNDAKLAPVGSVWRYLRTHHSTINLYNADESHPSLAGSYAAACALYTIIYKKDPSLISWNGSLSAQTAQIIRLAAKTIVFDTIASFDYTINPANASFTEVVSGNQLNCTNTSSSFDHLLWNFGDGNTSTQTNPTHFYNISGTYQVSLTVTKCGKSHTITKSIVVNEPLSNEDFHSTNNIKIYPNPTQGLVNIEFNSVQKLVELLVYDGRGVLIFQIQKNNSNQLNIDLTNVQLGIYMIQINSDHGTQFKKLVKY